MRNGKIGLGFYDDLFGVNDLFVNYGGYADPAQSLALPSIGIAPNSPPVAEKGFGYYWPVVEQHHHYDVSVFTGNTYGNGPFMWGDYSFSNLSINTVDYYSIFGHTQLWHVSSNSGYGNWFSAPGYYASNGHYWSSESAGIHTDSWFGSSDTFVFRNVENQYSHVEGGNFAMDNSHLVIHEGAGHHEQSIFAMLDSFAFRDTVVDSSHLQLGDLRIDAMRSDVRGGSQTVYADAFGGYGYGRSASIEIHDQWSVQGNGLFEQHIADYSSHSSDITAIGVSPYVLTGLQVDDMSLMLGIGGGKG